MSVDIGDAGGGVAGRPMSAAGYNLSPIGAYVWARQAQRCIAYLTTTSDDSPPSFSGNATEALTVMLSSDEVYLFEPGEDAKAVRPEDVELFRDLTQFELEEDEVPQESTTI